MATMTPNYLPMNLPSGAPPPMAGGGAMGKGGGRPGGRPGMGGKGGGMRPANPPRLPSVMGGGFAPPPPPAPGQPRFYQPGPPGMFDPIPQPQQQMAAENQLAQQAQQRQQLMQSMLNQATGQSGAQPLRSMGSQELMNAARNQFGVARRQPPRMMPGGGGRQFDPAPAPQPGLFNMMNTLFGG